jgi:hypothetical protein
MALRARYFVRRAPGLGLIISEWASPNLFLRGSRNE